MRVLVACEFSGRVRDAFTRRAGELGLDWDVWSCDLLETETDGQHIRGDCRDLFDPMWGWDLIIAHPPCQYLSKVGQKWLKGNPERWDQMLDSAQFFRDCLDAPAEYIAVENPIMHPHALAEVGRGVDFICHPYEFGEAPEDDAKKRTGWWLKHLPVLKPTSTRDGSTAYYHMMTSAGTAQRTKHRARFFPGMSYAMACQWGEFVHARVQRRNRLQGVSRYGG